MDSFVCFNFQAKVHMGIGALHMNTESIQEHKLLHYIPENTDDVFSLPGIISKPAEQSTDCNLNHEAYVGGAFAF